jgi:hypothetical protein
MSAVSSSVPRRSHARSAARLGLGVLLALAISLFGVAVAGASGRPAVHLEHHWFYPLSGRVTFVGSGTFTFQTEGGTDVIVNTPSTTYTEGDMTVTSSALQVGEFVDVRGTISSTSPLTVTATDVHIDLVTLKGTVVAPGYTSGATSIVIQGPEGFWRTIALESYTTYSEGPMRLGTSVTAENLMTGTEIEASGVVDANHTSLDAVSIHIQLDRVFGSVTGTSGDDIFISTRGGGSVTVVTNGSTLYFNWSGLATSSIVQMNADIEAFGSYQSDGTFLADFIGAGVGRGDDFPPPRSFEFPGFGHHHHHGGNH